MTPFVKNDFLKKKILEIKDAAKTKIGV